MINLYENTFLREIPSNLKNDKRVIHLADSLQNSLDVMIEWLDKINYRTNIENLPDEIIEHLIWESHIEHNEGLALATTREQKINLIKKAVGLHRIKGTPAAIENVLETIGLKGRVIEWWEEGLLPYNFFVEMDLKKKIGNIDHVKAMILEYKNVRSEFAGFVLLLEENLVIVVDITYHYPVFFKYCNHVRGSMHMQEYKADEINIENKTYDYPVRFFACEIKSMLFSDKEYIQEQSYQYPVIFGTCGEMNPINASFQEQKYDGDIRDETYMFLQKLNTCGEFVCE